MRVCLCVTGEERVCGSCTQSVCQVLCQCCVEDVESVAVGLGPFVCTPFCVCFCVRVTVKVVLFLKHRLDDSSRKWGYVCVSVFLFTHLMGYTVSRQKQREWTK